MFEFEIGMKVHNVSEDRDFEITEIKKINDTVFVELKCNNGNWSISEKELEKMVLDFKATIEGYAVTIEYERKINGVKYVRFNAEPDEKSINIYCCEDNSGKKDATVSPQTLKFNFKEIARYIEED